MTSNGFQIIEEYPFMGASPDDIAECNCCGKRIVEVKCAYSIAEEGKTFSELEYLTKSADGSLVMNEKHIYYYQIQIEMLSTGISMADFVVWTPNEHLVLRYFKNNEFCNRMVEKCSLFFHHAILPELLAKYYTRTHTKKTRKCKRKNENTCSAALQNCTASSSDI